MVIDWLTEWDSQISKCRQIEVEIVVSSEVWATKTDFQRETVDDVELFPERYPCCSLPILLDIKTAIFEWKHRTVIFHEHWEHLFLPDDVFPSAAI